MANEKDDDLIASAEEVISSNDIEYDTIPAWGKKLRIQSLSAGDIIDWAEAGEGEAKKTAGLRLILKSAVDSTGKLLFNEKHLGMLRAKNHKQTEEVVKAIIKLNGLTLRGVELKNA